MSRASSSSAVGGSRRSGRRVDLDRDVVLGAGLEDRARRRTRDPGRVPRLPVTSRPVQWPEDVGARVADRGDHPPGHGVRVHRRAWSGRWRPGRRAGPAARRLVEAAVVEDVDLDALEQRERAVRARRQVLVDRVDDVELAGQPLGAQAVGDGQPRRVVGEHEVLVAELDRGEGHLLDRRAAVGPVGVGVQVAAQRRAQVAAAARRRGPPCSCSSAASRSGISPRTAAAITFAVLAPDAGEVGQRAVLRPRRPPRRRQRQDRGGRAAVGLDLVGVLPAALEQERDPAQRAPPAHRRRRRRPPPSSAPSAPS